MKCPKCGYDQRRKYGYTCGNCGRQFVFQERGSITDGQFAAIVRAVSGNSTYFYTDNQLFAQWCRRFPQSTGTWQVVTGSIASAAATAGLLLSDATWPGVVGLIGGGLVLLGVALKPTSAPSRATMKLAADRWLRAQPMPKRLSKPNLHKPPPEWKEGDVYDYGAEKILIVDDDILVDFLVMNNVHATERVLIVSQTGYPGYVVPLVKRVLEEQPSVPVFLLHRSGEAGRFMRQLVLRQGIDLAERDVFDLGWTREEAERIKRLRPLFVANWGESIPVDLLHPKALTGALGAAMRHRVPIAVPLGGSSDAGDVSLVMAESHFG